MAPSPSKRSSSTRGVGDQRQGRSAGDARPRAVLHRQRHPSTSTTSCNVLLRRNVQEDIDLLASGGPQVQELALDLSVSRERGTHARRDLWIHGPHLLLARHEPAPREPADRAAPGRQRLRASSIGNGARSRTYSCNTSGRAAGAIVCAGKRGSTGGRSDSPATGRAARRRSTAASPRGTTRSEYRLSVRFHAAW